jgi:hypothetical protein
MIDPSKILLLALAEALARRLSPSHWDLSIADAVEALAQVAGDPELVDALRPVAPLLDASSSGTALDLAYGTPDAFDQLERACSAFAAEIEVEWGWLEENASVWAADADEVRQVVAEFERLTAALRRLARALR